MEAPESSSLRRSQRISIHQSAASGVASLAHDADNTSSCTTRHRSASTKKSSKETKKLQDVTNSSRKRAHTDDASHATAKKSKTPSATAAVTPMTAASGSMTSGPADDPAETALSLPEGVIDLYGHRRSSCCCCNDDDQCYLQHYGRDYLQSLKDWDRLYFPDNTCTSEKDDDETASFPHAASSVRTPTDRTNYIVHGSIHEEEEDDSLESGSTTMISNQPQLTTKMRAVLVDWLIELSQEYESLPETLHLAIALVDRSLCKLEISRQLFQCLGCACLWMASKLEQVTSPTVEALSYISADSYTTDEIAEMELKVCSALQFQLYRVTPYHFVHEFIKAATGGETCHRKTRVLYHMTLYLLELSLLPHDLVQTSPRKICAAAVYLARVILYGQAGWTPSLRHYTGYSNKWDLEDVVLTLYRYHAAAEESSLGAVFTKYSQDKFDKVALKTVPLKQNLGF